MTRALKSHRHEDIEHLLPEDLRMENIRNLPDAPKKGVKKGPGPLFLGACRRRGQAIMKLKPEIKQGRPRTKFSREEVEEDAMKRLLPRALRVLEEQLEANDPRVRQAAAIKVVEYNKGKPTQNVVAQVDNVNRIVYESAAWRPSEDAEEIEISPAEILELPPAGDVA